MSGGLQLSVTLASEHSTSSLGYLHQSAHPPMQTHTYTYLKIRHTLQRKLTPLLGQPLDYCEITVLITF